VRRVVLSKLFTLASVLVVLLGLSSSAFAADPATPTAQPNKVLAFAIYPADQRVGAYFSPTIKAGEHATLHVVLANTGDITFDARTYAINAATAPNGGFRAADTDAKPEGVTTWLDYPRQIVSLDPGKGVQIPLKINVPKDTAPGQYLTSLIMETANARDVQGTDVFKKVIRQAVPVFITVPGTLAPKFEITDIALTAIDGGAALTIGIKNPGNIRVQPTGNVVVKDQNGTRLLSVPVVMDSVYARDATTLTVGLPALPGGTYSVQVDLHDPDTGAKAKASEAAITVQAPASPIAQAALTISSATAAPQPSLKKIQFLQVDAKITNTGAPIANARLTLHVTRNDKVVEDYSLSSSLALPTGDTAIQSRYIPAAGWKSGTWAFTLTLETVDPATGVNVVVGSTDLGGPIVVP